MTAHEKFRTFLFSYEHDGKTWAFDIKATSPEDAMARVAKIARARYDGVLMGTWSVPNWFGRLMAWIK